MAESEIISTKDLMGNSGEIIKSSDMFAEPSKVKPIELKPMPSPFENMSDVEMSWISAGLEPPPGVKNIGRSPREGLFEQYVPDLTGGSLIPLKKQIEDTIAGAPIKETWFTVDTGMEIGSLWVAGKVLPVIARPIANKIRGLLKLPIKPEYIPDIANFLKNKDMGAIREWVDSIAGKERVKGKPVYRGEPTPTTPMKPLEVKGEIPKPEPKVEISPEIQLEKAYSDAISETPVDLGKVKALKTALNQPELSPTAKDQFALPGIKQGLEMKGVKEVTPTLEGTPLMEAAQKAKVEKLQPRLELGKKENIPNMMDFDIGLWFSEHGKIITTKNPKTGRLESPGIDMTAFSRREGATKAVGRYSPFAKAGSGKGQTFDVLFQELRANGYNGTIDDALAQLEGRLTEGIGGKVTEEELGKLFWGREMQATVIPGGKEFIEKDVVPKALQLGSGLKDTWERFKHLVVPRAGVKRDVLDTIMSMKGERDKAEFILEQTNKRARSFFDKLPQEENIAFIDRIKMGENQPSPILQQLSDMLRTMDDALGTEIQRYNPKMSWLENHFRVLWKTIPGTTEEGFRGVFRKPLEGTKGFFKQHTLENMTEGIEKGGIPYSYNPVRMFEAHYADAMKYITANKMWDGLGEIGAREFVKFAQKPPEGFVRLADPLARVFFHVPQGMVNAGEWWVDEGAGRLLNNFLSRDMVRENAAGRGLMWIKNSTTAAELAFNAFHAVFETVETVSSGVAQGARGIWNVGVLQKNWDAIGKGFKDIITAPFTPLTTERMGGSAIKYITDKEAFLETIRGKSFIKNFPEATVLINDLFTGGGKLAMSQDYKIKSIQTFQNALIENNYIGAAIRSIPALNEVMMKPLFEIYIPRLKVGMFLKEYSLVLSERSADLEAGKITRPELARTVWDFVENRLGEMNFDNLFWNRTLKSGLQLMVRSVTWKLGNIRAFGRAFSEQAIEFASAAKEFRMPRLEQEFAWMWGLAATTAAMSSTIMYMATGQTPQDLIDYIYPKIDKEGNRVSLPTYMRDLFSLVHSPISYIQHSLSGWISRFSEVIQNKDFYGVEVHSPEESFINQRLDDLIHMVPLPFGVSSYKRMKEEKQPIERQVSGFLGFTKAPYYIEQTTAEQKASELIMAYIPERPRTKEEFARAKIAKGYAMDLSKKIKEKQDLTETVSQIASDVKTGKLHLDDVKRIQRNLKEPLERRTERLSLSDVFKVWDVANDGEKIRLKPIIAKKIINLENSPDELKPMIPQIYKFLGKPQGDKP